MWREVLVPPHGAEHAQSLGAVVAATASTSVVASASATASASVASASVASASVAS
eukprot:SAG11_NODE_3664_length_2300_cov_19.540209_2_plen_54_part_01